MVRGPLQAFCLCMLSLVCLHELQAVHTIQALLSIAGILLIKELFRVTCELIGMVHRSLSWGLSGLLLCADTTETLLGFASTSATNTNSNRGWFTGHPKWVASAGN